MAKRYTDEALFELAREALAAHGPELSYVEFCAHSGVGPRTIAVRFGTWTRFRELAGLPARPKGNLKLRRYSRDELLARMREEVRVHGRDITESMFCKSVGVSPSTIRFYFGAWSKLREAAGLDARIHGNPRRRQYSAERLIDRLRDKVEQWGENLNMKLFIRETGIAQGTIEYYFGSWHNFRGAAGLERRLRGKRLRISNEEILEDLGRLIGIKKAFPTAEQYDESGIVRSRTVMDRFGRPWEQVRQAYADWVEYRRAFPKPLWAAPPRKKKRTEEEIADDVERQMREEDAEWMRREEERVKRGGGESVSGE